MANDVIKFSVPPFRDSETLDGSTECSINHATHYGAFIEDAIDVEEARLSYAIEKRREIFEQVDAVHRLERVAPGDASGWFKELTEDYILGKGQSGKGNQGLGRFMLDSIW